MINDQANLDSKRQSVSPWKGKRPRVNKVRGPSQACVFLVRNGSQIVRHAVSQAANRTGQTEADQGNCGNHSDDMRPLPL